MTQSLSYSVVFWHLLADGTDFHTPPVVLLSDCVHGTSDHALKSVSNPKLPPSEDVPTRPCEQGIISTFMAYLSKDKLLMD
jgi:hypothetical protein